MRPSPETTVYGVPPTEAKERTGESTPPGIDAPGPLEPAAFDAGACSATERLGHLCGEVGQDEVGSGPLEDGELLEGHRRPVDPARPRRLP